MNYIFNKKCNLDTLKEEISNSLISVPINYINGTETTTDIYFVGSLTNNEVIILSSIINSHNPVSQAEVIRNAVQSAISFGAEILEDFIVENVALGITQRGLTAHVRRTTASLIICIQTGSLYDAISELKLIDPANLDPVILSSERLLSFRNRIETYLGIPLSSVWNQ